MTTNSVVDTAPSQVPNVFNAAQRLTLKERLLLAKLLLGSVLGTSETAMHLDTSREDPAETATKTMSDDWPPDFFGTTAGAWAGEPLVREPQGDYELRAELQ